MLHPVPFVRGRISPLRHHRHRSARSGTSTARSSRPSSITSRCRPPCWARSRRSDGRCARVNALTGLGYTFTSGSAKARLHSPRHGRPAPLAAEPRRPVRAGAEPRRPRRHARARHRRRTHRADPGLRRRRRRAAADARARRPRDGGVRRPAARRQGHPHPDRGAAAAARSAARMSSCCSPERPIPPIPRRRASAEPGRLGPEPGVTCSAMSRRSRRSGRARISRCCRRGARACR